MEMDIGNIAVGEIMGLAYQYGIGGDSENTREQRRCLGNCVGSDAFIRNRPTKRAMAFFFLILII